MAQRDDKVANDGEGITDRWTQYHDNGRIITHAPSSLTGNKGGRPLDYKTLAPLVLSPTTRVEYNTRKASAFLPTPPPTAVDFQGSNPYSRHYSIYSTTPQRYLQALNRVPRFNEASTRSLVQRDHTTNARIPFTSDIGHLTEIKVYELLQQQEHELAKEKTMILVNLNLKLVKHSGGTLKSSLNIPSFNFQDSARTVLYLILGRPEVTRVVFYDDITGRRTKDEARLFNELCRAHRAIIEVFVMVNGLNRYMKTALTDDERGYRMISLVEGLELGYWIKLLRLPGHQAVQNSLHLSQSKL